MKAAYQTLKYNATRRGLPFTITYKDFEKFALKTKLMTNRGRGKESYTVDRIDGQLGYVPGNLQVLTLSDNGYKGYMERVIYWEEGTGMRSKVLRGNTKEQNDPF